DLYFTFFFQAEDGIRDFHVTGVQTCALPISHDLMPYFRQHCRLHKPYVANTKYCYFHAGKLLRCIEKNSCQSLSKQKTGQMLYRGPYAYSPATPLMILTLPQVLQPGQSQCRCAPEKPHLTQWYAGFSAITLSTNCFNSCKFSFASPSECSRCNSTRRFSALIEGFLFNCSAIKSAAA